MAELSPPLKHAKYFFDINTMNTADVLFMYRSVQKSKEYRFKNSMCSLQH